MRTRERRVQRVVCAQLIVTVGLTWVAIRIAIRGVEHRLVLATSPDNLRTE